MDAIAPTTFDPGTDSASFRNALGSFVTGVTIITTDSPEGQQLCQRVARPAAGAVVACQGIQTL